VTRIILVICAVLALGLAGAAQGATPPDFHLRGTPKLYVVNGPVGAGRPTVYVMFRSSQHLHEPRLVVAKIHGIGGRTYAARHDPLANCYRSASFFAKSTGTNPRLKAGAAYTVEFVVRATSHAPTDGPAVATRKLSAHAFAPRTPQSSPSC
jgi:hypothetical protein